MILNEERESGAGAARKEQYYLSTALLYMAWTHTHYASAAVMMRRPQNRRMRAPTKTSSKCCVWNPGTNILIGLVFHLPRCDFFRKDVSTFPTTENDLAERLTMYNDEKQRPVLFGRGKEQILTIGL